MFQYKLAQNFRNHAPAAVPFPRGLIGPGASGVAAGHGLGRGPLGALAAVVLGGVLMVANMTASKREAPVVEAPAAVVKAPAVAQAAAPPEPAIPAATGAAAANPKAAARVDMTPTGALAGEAPPKPHRKPHVPKKKAVDVKR